MPAIGALLVALAEVFVSVFIKVLAIRMAFRAAVAAVLIASATAAYFAVQAFIDGLALPALPGSVATAWYMVNGDAILVCVAAIVGIETTIAFYLFARRNIKFVAGF